MKILLTGATGFIGKQLCKALSFEGHELVVLTRSKADAKYRVPAPHAAIEWKDIRDPSSIRELSVLQNVDAVIHLAGESIVSKRWNPSFKKKMRDSRILGTQSLIKLLESSGSPKPKVFLTASATGYYGDCGDQLVDESHPPGSDFLAKICEEWESTLFDSSLSDIRKIALRIGIVLGKGGGALEKMIPAFTSGFGASLGNGKEWMSWIHIDDLISIIMACLVNEKISGPVNACSPNPVTNQEFTQSLAKSLHKSSVLKIPSPLLRAAVGEVAHTLLSSQRVVPEKLKSLKFSFQHSRIDSALQAILGDSYALGYDRFLNQSWIPTPIEDVFAFFASASNLEAITPPWLKFKVLNQSTLNLQEGTLINYSLTLHGLRVKWKTEISEWNPPLKFVDTQIQGPYSFWQHSHSFQSLNGGTLIEDQVLYRLPLGILGGLLAGSFVKNDIRQIFAYRSQKIFEALIPRP